MALQEHSGSNVVAPAKVVEQVVQQVSMIGTLPKVMVSINNWQGRFDNNLLGRTRQPSFVRRIYTAEPGRLAGNCHGRLQLLYAAL
jgi:hypothetical protein